VCEGASPARARGRPPPAGGGGGGGVFIYLSSPSGALRRPSAATTIRSDNATWASLAPP